MQRTRRATVAKPPKSIRSIREKVLADLDFSEKDAAQADFRVALTLQIHQRIRQLGLTQAQAAEKLGLKQPHVSKLMDARPGGFSIERLLLILSALDVNIDIVVRPNPPREKLRRGEVRVVLSPTE